MCTNEGVGGGWEGNGSQKYVLYRALIRALYYRVLCTLKGGPGFYWGAPPPRLGVSLDEAWRYFVNI